MSKGFRFGMYRGEHVDILYGNVKHAFFQVNIALYFSFFTKMSFISKKNDLYKKKAQATQNRLNCCGNCKKNEPDSSSNHFAQDN